MGVERGRAAAAAAATASPAAPANERPRIRRGAPAAIQHARFPIPPRVHAARAAGPATRQANATIRHREPDSPHGGLFGADASVSKPLRAIESAYSA